jgi:uncharacterized membrane protein
MEKEVRTLAQHLLHTGLAPLEPRERRVIARVAKRVYRARRLNQVFDQPTFGEKLADRVAAIGGSWTFIIGFVLFMAGWAAVNAIVLAGRAFDPYPFVFLNLLLSMLAAIQAPLIMMSQNRQAAKDRLATALDYEIDLTAENAIAQLHGKVDALHGRLDLVALTTTVETPRGEISAAACVSAPISNAPLAA